MQDGKRDGIDLKLFELLSELEDLADPAGMSVILAKLLETYDLKSIAYLGSGLTGEPGEAPYLAVTYSSDWIEHYKVQQFVDIDPVVQLGMRRLLPLDWDNFDRSDKNVSRLFGEASDFGLGRHGTSLPVHGQQGDRALVSITSDASDREWGYLRLDYLRDFQLLALHMHQTILRLEGRAVERASLSPRERECLLWISEGKTHWECARILGLSEHTVKCYLESARHKLNAANSTHAVKKAGQANLLSHLP